MSQVDVSQLLGQVQNTVAVAQTVGQSDDPVGAGAGFAGIPRALSNPTKDPFGFVLQVGALLFGAEFLENQLNGLLRNMAGTSREPGKLELFLKDELYRMCVSGLGERAIPAEFANPGYTVPVRLLDLFELFRLEPASDEGKVAQSGFERAVVENVLRRPGIAFRLPDIPYLNFSTDITGQAVTIRFVAGAGPSPAPTRLVDLFGDIIYSPDFRLLDPARISLDILDVVLGVSAKFRAARALEREEWLSQVVENLSSETVAETLFDFSPPALAAARAKVTSRQAGVNIGASCGPVVGVQIPPGQVVVPLVSNTGEPDLQLAYHQLSNTYLSPSGASASGGTPEAPVRDALTKGLAKALILVLARNTVFAPRVWSLLVLGRLIRGGYSTSDLNRYLSRGINEADFKDLVTGVRPLLEATVKVLIRAGVDYLAPKLVKKLLKLLRPLLKKVAREKTAAYEAILESLVPLGVAKLF